MPPPLSPFKCAYRERFKEFILSKGLDPDSADIPVQVREEFYAQLTEDEYRACSYHQANWRSIAGESVRIIRKIGEYPSR
ncbi:MAG TPA: hypothetical protein DHU96_34825 [Actinobacteria bacterium]|nr:hypothetical protein [Actinomycetota bacterium]